MGYVVQPEQENKLTPLKVEGVAYFTSSEVARFVGVSRQTLWRWRQVGKIPAGRRYRDRQVVFTRQEVDAIRAYAHRIEPAEPTTPNQLKLFNDNSPKRSV
jgi:excisionase family DNA binding protein